MISKGRSFVSILCVLALLPMSALAQEKAEAQAADQSTQQAIDDAKDTTNEAIEAAKQAVLEAIKAALKNVLDREVEFGNETDLIGEKIIDSLDGIRFIFELEEATGIKFPERDLEEEGFFRIAKLLDYLQQASN